MKAPTVTFEIMRSKPGHIDPPRNQKFMVQHQPHTTVLDGLEQIRLTQDATLMYRHCCHHASCGTCACTINGTPALACTTRITNLNSDIITLAPLPNHTCLGDLAVDMTSFFRDMDPNWTHIRPCENTTTARTPEGVDQLKRLENCIECGCCVAACPVILSSRSFIGPAVLAAMSNEMRNRPFSKKTQRKLAATPRGAAMCKRHLACNRVCPSKVYPARHIAGLQRMLGIKVTPETSKK